MAAPRSPLTAPLRTTVVGSYPQPDWLVDRSQLGSRLPPRIRAGEIWRPAVFQRDGWESYEGRSLVGDAADRAHELLAAHEVPPLADDLQRHIDAVIAAYRATAR